MLQITKSNANGNQGRVYWHCPSRYDKQARQSCTYLKFVDEEDEEVTSVNASIRIVTAEEVDDI